MFMKTSREYFLIGWFTCLVILAALSMSMMSYLEVFEDPRCRLSYLTTLHLVWYIIGVISCGSSFILAKRRPDWFAFISLGIAIAILVGAFLQGETGHGLPYVRLGTLHINAIETSAIAFLVPIAFLFAHYLDHFLALVSIYLLLVLFAFIGSDNANTCLGLAVGTIALLDYRDRRRVKTLILSLLSFFIAAWTLIKGMFFIPGSAVRVLMSSYPFTLYDLTAGANGHTELIFSHMVERFGIATACGCVILIFLIVLQLFVLSWITKERAACFAAAGLGIFLAGQAIMDLLVATGFIMNPNSGVSLPFVSYGGSQLVIELAVSGGVLALLCRRSSLVAI